MTEVRSTLISRCGDQARDHQMELPDLLAELSKFDEVFLKVLDSHSSPISVGQLAAESRRFGGTTEEARSARL